VQFPNVVERKKLKKERKVMQVTSRPQSIFVANPLRDSRACFHVDRVCHGKEIRHSLAILLSGNVETERILQEIQHLLLEIVVSGHNAALCVVGGKDTGKSRCLFGTLLEFDGVLSKFADAYYGLEGNRFVELAISQIYDEQVSAGAIRGISRQ